MRGRREGGRRKERNEGGGKGWDGGMKTRSTFYTIMCSYYDFKIVDRQLGILCG